MSNQDVPQKPPFHQRTELNISFKSSPGRGRADRSDCVEKSVNLFSCWFWNPDCLFWDENEFVPSMNIFLLHILLRNKLKLNTEFFFNWSSKFACGATETAQQWGARAAFTEEPGLVVSAHRPFTTICNSSSRRFNAFLWPPRKPGLTMAYIHKWRQNTHIQKTKNSLEIAWMYMSICFSVCAWTYVHGHVAVRRKPWCHCSDTIHLVWCRFSPWPGTQQVD